MCYLDGNDVSLHHKQCSVDYIPQQCEQSITTIWRMCRHEVNNVLSRMMYHYTINNVPYSVDYIPQQCEQSITTICVSP